ncbi:caspase family protein [Uniformispora flossi]|uniref:caspase family protein n=1 Tax=Uniformispora flossi TaxID=3390723 RepID=UPI003C2D41D8
MADRTLNRPQRNTPLRPALPLTGHRPHTDVAADKIRSSSLTAGLRPSLIISNNGLLAHSSGEIQQVMAQADQSNGRHFFISVTVDRYRHLSDADQLQHARRDGASIGSLMQDFGYELALPGAGDYASAENIRTKLSYWSRDVGLGERDVVVFYFAGHGMTEERDRHYLLCYDTDEDDLAATALATEDVARILLGTKLQNLLLILDTCHGGVGAADAAGYALRQATRRLSSAKSGTGLWCLSSCRAKQEAVDGTFAEVLPQALAAVSARASQRQQFLDLTDVVDVVNQLFRARQASQTAELTGGLVTGLAPFLPNPQHRRVLPPQGTDLELQHRLAESVPYERDLYDHFGPRSRGVEFESEQGMYFSGRTNVLTELVRWMTAPDGDGRGRIVTGGPGSGKSAVLGRIVAQASGSYRSGHDAQSPPSTIPPEGSVHAAVHARHKRLEEVVDRLAHCLGHQVESAAGLLREISSRPPDGQPLVVVVDALDEAGSGTAADTGGRGEPRRIARELLRPMSEIPGVRLLVGTRRELVVSLGSSFTVLDIDDCDYRDDNAVAGYVTRVLLAAHEPDIRTPYRDQSALAAVVGQAVADRATGVFLVARMTARSLRTADEVMDVSQAAWEDGLPSEIGQALDDYLMRFGTDEERVRRLLTPLAFAEGQGLPRVQVWRELATALSGVPVGDDDITWVLKAAGAYIAEVTEQGRSVYRLYHQSLTEHLRADVAVDGVAIQERIVDALIGLVALADSGDRDWLEAPHYVRAYLATHAAAAARLPELLDDPGFLLAADPVTLLRALADLGDPRAQAARNAYEQMSHRMNAAASLRDRAAYLQLSARRCGADTLADRIDKLGVDLPWSARWAVWSQVGVHRRLVGHKQSVDAVTFGDLDGRAVAVTGSADGTARIWDLTTQQPIGPPLSGHSAVTAVATGESTTTRSR